jgi:glycosyltransferase involved in cell wall biosynthesis
MQIDKAGNKQNILYVFGGEKAQGAEIVIERLMDYNHHNVASTHLIISPGKFASDLAASGKPYLITQLNNLKKLNRSSTGKLNYVALAAKNYLSVPYKILRYIRKNNIHVVHANTIVPASYLTPLIVYCRLFLPKVQWFWSDHDLKYFSQLEISLSNLCAKAYNKTLVVSEAVKRKYVENQHKIIVLYNGLDPMVFKPDNSKRALFRKNQNLTDDTLVIGIAASINPDKGQLELISAFNNLSKTFPNACLLLAGSYAAHFPEYCEKVRLAINESPKIIYAGYVADMTAFYNGCDIIVNNSDNKRSESLGTTIYEAMACGKVVIASRTGGTPEIITDKEDGFMFEPESISDLEQTLSMVIKRYDSLNLIRIAAREKIIKKFNISTMVETYNQILNTNQQPSFHN